MRSIAQIVLFLILLALMTTSFSAEQYFLKQITLNQNDQASLQRGAQLYFNYCSGCHSLRYETYQHLGQIIGLNTLPKKDMTRLIQQSFLFDPDGAIQQPIISAMNSKQAYHWFGVAPADLTNITVIRSPTWIYNFLRGFYRDDIRPNGTNNLIAPNTTMPNVLLSLRGETQAVFLKNQFDHLITTQPGQLNPLAFDQAAYDLVNFLQAMEKPHATLSLLIGISVLAFLTILFIIVYLLYRTTPNK